MSTFLTPREAAKVANVGLTTLYGALRRGELRHSRVPPGLRTIRIEPSAIAEWLAKFERQPKP